MGNIKQNSALVVTAALLFTATCYGNPNATGAKSACIAGVYSGQTAVHRFPGPTSSKPTDVFGAVNSDGTGYFVSASTAGSDIRLFQDLQGKAMEHEVPTEGRGVARGARSWQFETKSGSTGGKASTLKGSARFGDGFVSLNLQKLPITHQKILLDRRGGTYHGADISRLTKVVITLDSNGNFTGTDDRGCGISGRLTQVGDSNLFNTRINISGTTACHGEMLGIAFFDNRDRTGQFSGAKGTYLYLIGANGEFDHGFAMELSYLRK